MAEIPMQAPAVTIHLGRDPVTGEVLRVDPPSEVEAARASPASIRYDVLYEIAATFGLDYNAVCKCVGASLPAPLPDERETFESALLEIMGGNRVWIERADEEAQGDRLSYCEVWARRAWLLWQRARHGADNVSPRSDEKESGGPQ